MLCPPVVDAPLHQVEAKLTHGIFMERSDCYLAFTRPPWKQQTVSLVSLVKLLMRRIRRLMAKIIVKGSGDNVDSQNTSQHALKSCELSFRFCA